LNSVCAGLRDLPMERLETEREILRTEAAGRGGACVGGEPSTAGGTQAQVPLGVGGPGRPIAVQDVSGQFRGGDVGQCPPLGHAGASFLRRTPVVSRHPYRGTGHGGCIAHRAHLCGG
ncbi:hypothetical protein PYK79_56245, partial [Streptomyces sp. ID05-04B]|uniref:hypothetical protein n=1 Tax=Streptomyces sp. ID05-04B TaxID=3028661 RepID=UPI0029C52E4E